MPRGRGNLLPKLKQQKSWRENGFSLLEAGISLAPGNKTRGSTQLQIIKRTLIFFGGGGGAQGEQRGEPDSFLLPSPQHLTFSEKSALAEAADRFIYLFTYLSIYPSFPPPLQIARFSWQLEEFSSGRPAWPLSATGNITSDPINRFPEGVLIIIIIILI